MCVEVRGQLAGVGSLLPPCRTQGSSRGHQPWQWAPLPLSYPCPLQFFLNLELRSLMLHGILSGLGLALRSLALVVSQRPLVSKKMSTLRLASGFAAWGCTEDRVGGSGGQEGVGVSPIACPFLP